MNTDDNALVEFGAPRDLLGYHRYDRYLARIYSTGWPYGRLSPLLTGFDDPADFALLAESLLAHGKVREAERFIRRAGRQAGAAARLAARLSTTPELPDDLDPPRLPVNLAAPELLRYAREYARAERMVASGAFKQAQALLDGWPHDLGAQAGPDLALFYGYTAWRADELDDALDALLPLQRDAA